ncbi:MAG: hypothetical protein DMG97_36615 [Acidobacteria bacterium]|nr:MAG: hypothetical protein DMG97_36615 [Acidobacteriota bacterium]
MYYGEQQSTKHMVFVAGKTLVLRYYKITLLEISSVFSSMAPMQSGLPFLLAQLFAIALCVLLVVVAAIRFCNEVTRAA